MNLSLRLSVIAIAGCLAACGGGGGSTPPTPPTPSSAPVASPTPKPSAAPSVAPSQAASATPVASPSVVPSPSPSAGGGTSATTVTGHVYQLAGPLSSSTWNLAAPTGCPGNGQNCASYPPAPSGLPSAGATPTAGAPIVGASVYVVASPSAAVTNGIPISSLSIATTGIDGSFAAGVSLPAGTQVGVVVVYGSTVSTSTGVTNLGFALTHASAKVGTPATLYVDSLSADEQSAIADLNSDRAGAGLAPVASDLFAQLTARLSVAQRPGAAVCESNENDNATYAAFGGLTGGTGSGPWLDGNGSDWKSIVDYGSPWNTSNEVYVGLAALYAATPCGTQFVPGSTFNYFEGMYVAS